MRRLVLLLLTCVFFVGMPLNAWGVPTDPRITAAVETWEYKPLYVDPQYSSLVGSQQAQVIHRLRTFGVPVYVAAIPTGTWFQEKGDTELLAGWLAAANGKAGIYLVMDGSSTTGVAHKVNAWGPRDTWAGADKSLDDQLVTYLDRVKVDDKYEAEPARTEPLPPIPERTSSRERFTVGKAISNGVGGGVLGLVGGAILAAGVLGVAALVAVLGVAVAARRGGGRL
ncbi:hypothetical protein EV643_101388 [Kribbella sp. VKM Ac-2527]|uniref:TPM domain-containing protein n=1 Tax=Kribbella caucasensis TaxID=2512215 RepID=A0A4R6KSY1_9ACTN|nr:hypothetical protein [Kribbella sp. VKM Ac-2527]TDO54598.1 hypothetical protein EV643_101388 [Kribbella sp. VKM Ac-2527]